MSDPSVPKPKAGWYDDPEMVNTRRYWDGEKWTQHRQEDASAPGAKATDSSFPVRTVVLVLVALLVLGGVFVGISAIIGNAKKFTVSGQLELSGSGSLSSGGTCTGTGGFDDIREGAEVVIRDSKSNRIAVGNLEEGKPSDGACDFDFTVTGVPDKGTLYSVEVTHRGEITFRKSQATSLFLTLR